MYTCSVWVVMVTSGWRSTQLGMYMYMYIHVHVLYVYTDSDINTSLVQYRLCVDLLIIICGLRRDMYTCTCNHCKHSTLCTYIYMYMTLCNSCMYMTLCCIQETE